MGDGSISQDEIDNILNSLTGDSTTPDNTGGGGGGGGGGLDSMGITPAEKQKTKTRDDIDTENIPLLLDVKMKLSVVLGSTRRSIGDVLDLGKGSIVELERFTEEDVDIYINDQMVGKGQIVALDDEYGVKITRILKPLKYSKPKG